MSNRHRTHTSDPDERGMWLRHRSAPERFPTFAGVLPVMERDPDDLSLADEPTEEVTLTAVPDALQNRENVTLEPAPERSPRATRRPRPSPLFGEGEIDAPYPVRATQHMEGRQSTLWETDLTDPGVEPAVIDQAAIEEPAWAPHSHDESITLEVDPQWREQIRAIDAAHEQSTPMEAVSHTLPSAFMHLDFVAPDFESTPAADDLCTDDLVLDDEDARNRVKLQTAQPAPLPAAPAVETTSLAQRAPLPMRSHAPVAAPITAAPAPVTIGQRAVHAIEAAAWFTLGALVFSGTGAATSLLVAAVLFVG